MSELQLLIERFDEASQRHKDKLVVQTGQHGTTVGHAAGGQDAQRELFALCEHAAHVLEKTGVRLPSSKPTVNDPDWRFLRWVLARAALGRPDGFSNLPIVRDANTDQPHPDWQETKDNPFRACALALRMYEGESDEKALRTPPPEVYAIRHGRRSVPLEPQEWYLFEYMKDRDKAEIEPVLEHVTGSKEVAEGTVKGMYGGLNQKLTSIAYPRKLGKKGGFFVWKPA